MGKFISISNFSPLSSSDEIPSKDGWLNYNDSNEYGTHPFYLETRYYEVNSNGGHDLVTNAETDFSKDYTSLSHGVFLRNAHGQEVLMGPSTITWRTIGGSIDLYFYSGPSQAEVTQNYVTSTVGVPAMQQYFTLGYHQCKWGYTGWADLQEVVANFSKAGIPLETIWCV
jgi:alpha-glucosidase